MACQRLSTTAKEILDKGHALMGEALLVHGIKTKNKSRKMSIIQDVLGDIAGRRIDEKWVLPQLVAKANEIIG